MEEKVIVRDGWGYKYVTKEEQKAREKFQEEERKKILKILKILGWTILGIVAFSLMISFLI